MILIKSTNIIDIILRI